MVDSCLAEPDLASRDWLIVVGCAAAGRVAQLVRASL